MPDTHRVPGDPPRTSQSTTEPARGDTLILGLAAAYGNLDRVHEEFDEQATQRSGTVSNYCWSRGNDCLATQDDLVNAILTTEASGIEGACVQVEALHRIAERVGTPLSGDERVMKAALWSITRVFRQHGAGSSRLDVMLDHHDPFRQDHTNVVEEWREFLARRDDPKPTEKADASA